MTIDEAIKILEEDTGDDTFFLPSDTTEAIKLSIEALKSVRTGRKVGLHFEAKCLPGETE